MAIRRRRRLSRATPTPSPTPTPGPTPTPSDTTAPTLSNATGTQTGQTTATIGVTTNEGNGQLYFFVSTSGTPPAAPALKAGTGAVVSGQQTVSATGAQSVNLISLTAATQYYTHWLHRDAAGNDSVILTGPGFVTAAAGEAVISPAVTYERSTYDLTKVGQITNRPAWMLDQSSTPSGGQGVCWPQIQKVPSAAYPERRFLIYTTDHTNYAGGVGAHVCVGDPTIQANWREYDDVVANTDWLNDIPSKASTAPFYFGANNDINGTHQTETARVLKIGSTWHMTYQEGGVPGARNQATLKATSSDFLNWSGPAGPLMQVSALDAPGDGHHGYAEPFVNPGTYYPHTYLMYSLIGGQGQPTWGMWGSSDFENWSFLTAVGAAAGRASPDFGASGSWARISPQCFHPQSFKKTRQGWAVLAEILRPSAGGNTAPAQGTIYELLLADDLLTPIGKPIPVIARGATGSFDAGSIERPYLDSYNGQVLMTYGGANATNDKRGGLAVGSPRNPQNTWFKELWPYKPAPTKTSSFDLRGASALPAGLVAVTAGTTTPAITFDAGGVSAVVDGTMAVPGEVFFYHDEPIVPGDTEYTDVWVEGWDTTTAGAYRVPYIGFASAKTVSGGITDGMFATINGTSDQLLYGKTFVAGAQPVSPIKSDFHAGPGYGNNQNRSKSKKRIGLRIFWRDAKAFLLGEGGAELHELVNMGAALDKTKTYYPVVGFTGVGTATGTERIQKISVVKHVAAAAAGDATLGTSASAVSTTDAASYSFPALDIGTAVANRKVAFFVTGSSAAALASLALTVTPDTGRAVTATLQKVQQYQGTANNFVALFTADLPTGTTCTAAVTLSATAQRCGIRSHVMYGVATTPTFVGSTFSTSGAGPQEVVAAKPKGGICLAGATVSWSNTGHTSAAETVQVDTSNLPVSLSTSGGAVNTWRGIRNGPTSAQAIEATNSGCAVMIVASFAKA